MEKSPVTLRSLAAELGVSAMTVSLALRQSHEVSATTRTRVQELAAKRGYRPDPQVGKLMQHLRTRREARATANLCGLRQSWGFSPAPPGNYMDRLTGDLAVRARQLGFTFSLLSLDDYPTRTQLTRVLVSRGVEGLLLLPMRQSCDLTDRLDWSRFSTVALTSSVTAPRFHGVTPNHFDNMILACRRLAEAGYERIGLAMTAELDLRVNHRWTGGIAWQSQFGGLAKVQPLIDPSHSLNLDPEAFTAWMVKERPDAVIVGAPDPSIPAKALARMPVGRRPKIVTMNWPDGGADFGINQRPERIGIVGLEALCAMIIRGEKGLPQLPHQTMIDGSWETAP